MKNIKSLFMALIIMIIVLICFESISTAAQVTRIHSSRKYIYIDGSISDGFVIGAKVCFYETSGEEITCGRIEQASESLARVRVNNRIAKQIRYGMEARLSVEEKKEEATEPKLCTDDSECGDYGYCVNGKCRK